VFYSVGEKGVGFRMGCFKWFKILNCSQSIFYIIISACYDSFEKQGSVLVQYLELLMSGKVKESIAGVAC
jgi:hypothetical protein